MLLLFLHQNVLYLLCGVTEVWYMNASPFTLSLPTVRVHWNYYTKSFSGESKRVNTPNLYSLQVSEVVNPDKCRLSVNGWFHGPSVPRPPPYIEPRHALAPHVNIEVWQNKEKFSIISCFIVLQSWISCLFLKNKAQLSKFFIAKDLVFHIE